MKILHTSITVLLMALAPLACIVEASAHPSGFDEGVVTPAELRVAVADGDEDLTYNFLDEPTPILETTIDASGSISLTDGAVQGDLITSSFSGGSVSVSIAPPAGWSLDSVTWAGGGSGTISVPDEGTETTHPFSYTVSQNGTSLSSDGNFKVKKQSDGQPSGG